MKTNFIHKLEELNNNIVELFSTQQNQEIDSILRNNFRIRDIGENELEPCFTTKIDRAMKLLVQIDNCQVIITQYFIVTTY